MSQRRPNSLLNRLFVRQHRRHRLRTQLFEQLEPRIVLNSDWQNPARPLDVNNDLLVTPLDILQVVNQLNRSGTSPLPPRTNPLDYYYDTSGDGLVSPLDILRVINGLNQGISYPDPGDSSPAAAGFISIPLTSLSGNPGQIVRLSAERSFGRVDFHEMGLFFADDAAGTVQGVAPDSARYASTVFQSGRRRVLFSRFDTFRTTAQVDLPAASHLFVYVLQRSMHRAAHFGALATCLPIVRLPLIPRLVLCESFGFPRIPQACPADPSASRYTRLLHGSGRRLMPFGQVAGLSPQNRHEA